ncbi:MAG: UbiX family flavin prenyltransferase [Clostridia bacterium]|nr:UbiX family flavin prenyltransferase [Clostridia bacterium]
MSAYVVAITGASGALYAQATLRALKDVGCRIYVTITGPGQRVLDYELGWLLTGTPGEKEARLRQLLGYDAEDSSLRYFDWEDIGALIASGSAKTKGMIIVPCTMSTLSGIAVGRAGNLIERAADIMLKERRPLVIVPRETPLNQIHLQNMLTLAQMGVHIIPAMPAFYHHPQTIDDLANFMVGRVLDVFGLEHELYKRWEGE